MLLNSEMWIARRFLPVLILSILALGKQLQFQLDYSIPENEPIGYRICYLDRDLQRKDLISFSSICDGGCKDLRYRLREASAFLELDETTAMLTTKSLVDFEKLCVGQCRKTLDAQISVTVNIWNERRLVAVVHVHIKVIDVDDNVVEFPADISRPYVLNLKEIFYGKGKSIALPRAVDKDVTPRFSSISYRLDFAPSQWDSMKMVELGVSNDSRLTLKQELDYEEVKEYAFTLVAWNQEIQAAGGSSNNLGQDAQLPILIKVLNENDMEPVFSQTFYSIDVAEDTQIGSVVFELKAVDEDSDAVLTYALNAAPGMNLSLPFEVEPDGNVRIAHSLDFEKRAEYELPVRASDGQYVASTQLHVRILDVNDEAPMFIVNPPTITVEENQPPNVLVGQVVVRDSDTLAVNGHIDCAEPLDDQERQPLRFVRRTIPPTTRDEPTPKAPSSVPELHFDLYTRHSLDREEGPHVRLSRLLCWDSANAELGEVVSLYGELQDSPRRPKATTRLTSTLTVSIYVQDRNDNAPVFTRSTFRAEVEEDSEIRKEIMQLTSKDYDTEENAVTHYRLNDQSEDASLFYLDEETGQLYAMTRFDRETRDTYKLQVIAFDASPNPLEIPSGAEAAPTSTASVIVRILDVNDHAPLIQESGELILPENKEAGFLVGHITANDPDAGANGEVFFKLVPDDPQAVFDTPQMTEIMGFRMTPNGSIFSTRVFDREEQSRYCFQVQATDRSPEAPLSSRTRLCVNIIDANDNMPILHSLEGPNELYPRDALVTRPTFAGVENPLSHVSYNLPRVHTSINEAPGYCVLVIQASDQDVGENAELRYFVDPSVNCSNPGRFDERYTDDRNLPMPNEDVGMGEEEDEEGEEMEKIKTFRQNAFRMDEKTGKLLLVRRLSSDEVGIYCLGLVVQDQGHSPLKSIQLIKLIVEDVPSRGTWQGAASSSKGASNRDSSSPPRLEARNILIVIVLSTVSAFLAAVLISAILCMVRPFHKGRRRGCGRDGVNGGARRCDGSSMNGLKLAPFSMEQPTSPTLLMHTRGGALSPLSCSDSATLDASSGMGDGAWILGPSGALINPYDGSTLKDETLRIPADGLASIWSPMHMTSSDCAFDTESLAPLGYTPEVLSTGTLQRGYTRHILLHQSPAVATSSATAGFNCHILHDGDLGTGTVEMVPISGFAQEEQRSDSGRGASDEEAIFQSPLRPILCGVPSSSNAKLSTDQNGYFGTLQSVSSNSNQFSATTTTTNSGIYLCASSLGGQAPPTFSTVASTSTIMPDTGGQRFVTTFVTSGKEVTSSLNRAGYSKRGDLPVSTSGPSQASAVQGNMNKTFSLPREGLCMTQSLLDDHTAEESASRICNEIDHLLFENMI